MTYPGGKAGAGVYQLIINQIPPHRAYVELFAGGAAILRHKRAALASIALEIDAKQAAALAELDTPGLTVLQGDALDLLRAFPWTADTFLYADPPYLQETRRTTGAIYRHEFATPAQHQALLCALRATPATIAISGYPSRMYSKILHDWRRIDYQAMTRGGTMAQECLWMNYPQPAELHDYRHLGTNYRERERIKRKTNRWRQRLANMPECERYAMLHALEELRSNPSSTTGPAEAISASQGEN